MLEGGVRGLEVRIPFNLGVPWKGAFQGSFKGFKV